MPYYRAGLGKRRDRRLCTRRTLRTRRTRASMTPGLCSVGDAGAAGLLGYDVLVSLLETVLSFLLALGILFRWGLKYFVDLGPWAFWVYIGVLVGILLWEIGRASCRGRV